MRDVAAQIDAWRAEGEPIALATVIETWGSAPRGAGAKMALTPSGKIAGSVSGGCVEAAVVEAGTEVLETGRPRLLRFGVADDTAWSVGLPCGGSIEVFVEPYDLALHEHLRAVVEEERRAALATVVGGGADLVGRKLLLFRDGRRVGSLGGVLDERVAPEVHQALDEGRSRRLRLEAAPGIDEALDVFIEVTEPAPTLVVVGGVHIAVALTAIAKTLGYRTVVVDPRRAFGSEARFPHADRILHAWPDDALSEIGLGASTAVAVLTHDPRLDDPALRVALRSPAFYVGALGSRAAQTKRRQRLIEAGLTEPEIARLRAPIGLDLGGRRPEEIALSVMTQVVAARNGRVL